MDVAALIVAIVALLFAVGAAGFGVYIQFQTYKATTDHLRGVEGSVSGFRTDMQGLVGELKGMTDTLVHAQQEQFNRMLEAFVTRPGAAIEVAEKTGESAGTLQQISEEMDALKEEIRQAASADEVQHKLDELASRVEAVSESTSRAARLAEAAARPATPLVDKALQEEAYRRWAREARAPMALSVQPGQVEPGGRVRIRLGWIPQGHVETVHVTVSSPTGQVWPAMITEDLAARIGRHGLIFPNGFDNASTLIDGTYRIFAQRVSPDGSAIGEPVVAEFLVRPGP